MQFARVVSNREQIVFQRLFLAPPYFLLCVGDRVVVHSNVCLTMQFLFDTEKVKCHPINQMKLNNHNTVKVTTTTITLAQTINCYSIEYDSSVSVRASLFFDNNGHDLLQLVNVPTTQLRS